MSMIKVYLNIFLIFSTFNINSCIGQQSTEDKCIEEFKIARTLAYNNSTSSAALDSALKIANTCLKCDNIRKEVVDFKITLMIAMQKFDEGVRFIQSRQESDFTYKYKKDFLAKTLSVLQLKSNHDTAAEKIMYKTMASDIEVYLTKEKMSENEFKEIYTDLFSVKRNYLDDNEIKLQVEMLKKKYPKKASFFDFFKELQ